jgi:CheY-like chemotaxis protein
MNRNRPSTILVVDDDPRNIRLMESILKTLGYAVISAEDGEQALKPLPSSTRRRASGRMMPRMSGFEVCRKLRSSMKPACCPSSW